MATRGTVRQSAAPAPASGASALLLLLALALSSTSFLLPGAHASDFNSPHSHHGVVDPFQPGDPKVKLDGKARSILGSGRPYQTQIQSGSSGRGLVVQDVDAPTDVVWSRILDYDHYADMVPKTVESKNYEVIKHKPSKKNPLEQTIYTRMKVGFPMIKLEFFIKHLYYPSLQSLTWTLDYTKKSDFDDSCGYWYVVPHADDPEHRTRVYYSVQVSMFDWVPKFVVDFMSSKALTDATGWVKKYSELEWAKDPRKKEMDQAMGVTETVAAGDSGQKRRGGIFGMVGRRRRKARVALDGEAVSLSSSSADGATGQVCDSSPAGAVAGERGQQALASVGWVRIFLLTLVSALAVYNVALFLDGISQ